MTRHLCYFKNRTLFIMRTERTHMNIKNVLVYYKNRNNPYKYSKFNVGQQI